MSDDAGLRSRASGADKDAAKGLSIIVPAYHEEENIRPLVTRLFAAMKEAGLTAEVIIVDDESEGSAETDKLVKELQSTHSALRIHCRKKVEGRGLSSAVLLGFDKAKYETVLCMDADLQHRPEEVAKVAEPVMSGRAEMSVGSRHVAGGGVGFDWSLSRRIISAGGKMLSYPVASTTDPMAGFFCTRKAVLERGKKTMDGKGFKIGLEIAVRCHCSPVEDVPITFDERVAGESKLSAKIYKQYLQQLAALYWHKFGVGLVAMFLLLLIIALYVARMTLTALR